MFLLSVCFHTQNLFSLRYLLSTFLLVVTFLFVHSSSPRHLRPILVTCRLKPALAPFVVLSLQSSASQLRLRDCCPSDYSHAYSMRPVIRLIPTIPSFLSAEQPASRAKARSVTRLLST